MDRWKFFDITHRDHIICNPLSVEKFDELIDLCRLNPGSRVIDIACGKAELLVRLAERTGARGVGVDASPYVVAEARQKALQRVPDADLTFVESDGAAYRAEPESYDLAICVGASWVFGGHRGTLRALAGLAKPGGLVMVGEPYWRTTPALEYLQAADMAESDFATHAGNVTIGVEEGLSPLYTMVSSEDDWDRYEGLQWQAAERYAAAHPGDPDCPEMLRRVHRSRYQYLRWGRDTFGWSVYLFMK